MVLTLAQDAKMVEGKTCWLCFFAGLLRLILDLFGRLNFQGREPCIDDVIQSIFNNGHCSDAYEPISFKLDLVIFTIEHHSLETGWP